jgi:hypothetical protein
MDSWLLYKALGMFEEPGLVPIEDGVDLIK